MDTTEQRAHNRMNVNVHSTVVTENNQRFSARCMDLSSHGIHLLSPKPARIGDTLTVSLEATKRGIVDFVVTAKVARCAAASSGQYELGAQVIDIV
ncbi:MAG: PilZ domain-containing protein [Litorivicinus sp.]